MEITGAGPALRDLQHRLLPRPPRTARRLRRELPGPTGEDSDLGARAVAGGAEPSFEPEALVHHAVFERRPWEALRDALLATDDLRAYKLNPELRSICAWASSTTARIRCSCRPPPRRSLSRRRPTNVLFCAPYAANVLGRCRASGAPPWHAPYFVAFDALQMAATARGAVRERVMVI